MKTPILCLALSVVLACNSGSASKERTYSTRAGQIEIILFHMEQRCESCNAVEEETIMLLEGEYREAFESGKIKFIPLNYQSEEGKEAAALLRAAGQTLFVVKGDSISNLTSAAFMYADTHPEYYRQALRSELDKFLK